MKKMDIHRWKDDKLNEMLMERFGYKKKKDPELLKEGFGEGKPAEGKWSEKKVYSEEEELEERRRTADRTVGRPVGPGRTKVSEASEEEGATNDAFAPNHYCIHHGGVDHGGSIQMAEAVDHNFNRKLGRVTHYNMKLRDGTILENVAAEDIHVTNASLAEGHAHGHRDEEGPSMPSAAAGVPHVPAGDYEGMAHAAIVAIVQLASEAGIEIDLTTGPDAEPEYDGEEYKEPLETAEDDLGAEVGEQELLSPEDL
jgi:hypothetical protein